MSVRKEKHKGRAREEMIYGDQMRHFITRLGSRRPYDAEVRYSDTE